MVLFSQAIFRNLRKENSSEKLRRNLYYIILRMGSKVIAMVIVKMLSLYFYLSEFFLQL